MENFSLLNLGTRDLRPLSVRHRRTRSSTRKNAGDTDHLLEAMTKKQKQSPSFSSTFFFTRKNTKSVGIFLDLLLICIFRRELSPARRRRASVLVGAATASMAIILSSTALLAGDTRTSTTGPQPGESNPSTRLRHRPSSSGILTCTST